MTRFRLLCRWFWLIPLCPMFSPAKPLRSLKIAEAFTQLSAKLQQADVRWDRLKISSQELLVCCKGPHFDDRHALRNTWKHFTTSWPFKVFKVLGRGPARGSRWGGNVSLEKRPFLQTKQRPPTVGPAERDGCGRHRGEFGLKTAESRLSKADETDSLAVCDLPLHPKKQRSLESSDNLQRFPKYIVEIDRIIESLTW